MSSLGSDRFKWDFLLKLASSPESTQSTLTDCSTGHEILTAQGACFDQAVVASLVQQAQGTPTSADIVRRLGRLLSDVAVPPAIEKRLSECARSGPVRLGLQIETKDLAAAPWECLLIGTNQEAPIGLHPNLHLYRWFESLKKGENPKPARRALLVLADPQSAAYAALVNGERELRSVANAFTSAECRGIELSELRFATPSSLKRCLAENTPDIVHFIGHGDVKASGGLLVLEGDQPHRD